MSRLGERYLRGGFGFLRPRLDSDSRSDSPNRLPVHSFLPPLRMADRASLGQLEQMGFNREASVAALMHHANDFEAALNALLRG